MKAGFGRGRPMKVDKGRFWQMKVDKCQILADEASKDR